MGLEKRPLEGVRILDFTWVGAGPRATRILADFGAEVIRIETSLRLDQLRAGPPIAEGKSGPNVSGRFNNVNSSKLAVTLNLNHPRGLEYTKRLVALSDVVINNFTPHVMEKWGLTYEELCQVRPDIIVASMPVMGSTGPYRDFGNFGAGILSETGLGYLTGFPGDPPGALGGAYPDHSCNPYHTAVAVLAALHHRDRTGCGQAIELAQFESTITFLAIPVLDYAANGRRWEPLGNHHPSAAPHGVYRCQGEERWCAIAVLDDADWQRFAQALGWPAWTQDSRFATAADRKACEAELDQLVEAWTREHKPEEVMETLQVAGVAAGVVQNGEDMFVKDAHLQARGYYIPLDHPEAGRTIYDGVPFQLSATPGYPSSPAPLVGQHNHAVFQELLGLTLEEVQAGEAQDVFR